MRGGGGGGAGLVWLALALWSHQALCQAPPPPFSPPGLRFASFEVIVPRKMAAPGRRRDPQELSYLLEVEGAGLVVQLRRARGFLLRHLPVFTYSEEGELQVDYPFLREDCYYQGALQGRPSSSIAALSTCSGGLRGFLQVGRKLYEIEPVHASATFQHVVYRLEDEAGKGRMGCGLTVEESCPEAVIPVHFVSETLPRDLWRTRARYVKVAVVVEHALYAHFGRNDTLVSQRMAEAVHLADSLYKPLGVRVVLVGLEIWSQKNLVVIPKSMSELLGAFNSWRQTTLVRHLRHDIGHLFVYQRFGSTLGMSCVGSVCDPTWASAVEAFITSSMLSFAITFSHQLGHSLGMRHDEKGCFCNHRSCIMAPIQSHTSSFSNCSYDSYFQVINSNSKQCLLVPPEHEKLFELKNCGNKVVESGEQCDCGSKLHCESDTCCQSNCMLRSGATCAFGKCCANCQFLPAGTVCRERTNVCDLPEFCTGVTEWCPEDTYVQDGTPCYDGAYCYHGKCSTHNEQCKRIFGKQAAVAPLSCFREINIKGDRFGNCGIADNTYRKCENRGVLCGKIQCINMDEIPNLVGNSTIIQTYVNNNFCWGTSDLNDTGAVKDGTKCGNSMICINRDCIKVSLLNYDCNLTKCHNRGVCNSHKNCHCNYGWAPPNCLKEGYGGSIDSGPSPPNSGNIGMTRSLVNVVAASAVFIVGVGIL
ncbi:disintegrin and metalloproteinase domain-containing protein 29 [Anolis carolinensis]|uniref:ADAM metallopeptidase domain 21 n=1 Tax=Anolis carolinensis TaxID=28377 RepID=H9GV75_ANOCA|nr:PREDICTED: disintegrin and metalloproteinase domain-containing protein 29-like [Anolis carolinensis]|eukprot:XP_003228946.1 PREDICTED: disintegrin and metalloproteinase domain-containing protein 29-like [Anolis carolinensis]